MLARTTHLSNYAFFLKSGFYFLPAILLYSERPLNSRLNDWVLLQVFFFLWIIGKQGMDKFHPLRQNIFYKIKPQELIQLDLTLSFVLICLIFLFIPSVSVPVNLIELEGSLFCEKEKRILSAMLKQVLPY